MSKARLDLAHFKMQVGDWTYIYEDNDYYYWDSDSDEEFTRRFWYKEDKRFAVSADSENPEHKIPLEETYNMTPEEWVYLRVRIKDRDKVKKLNRRFEKAKPRALAKAKAKKEAGKREREEEAAEQRRYRDEERRLEQREQDKRKQRSYGEVVRESERDLKLSITETVTTSSTGKSRFAESGSSTRGGTT